MDIKVMGLHKSSTFSNFGNHKLGSWFSTLGHPRRKVNFLKNSKSLTGFSMAKPVSVIKKRKNILPIIIVDDHNDALHHIYRAIGAKKLPFNNGVMIHFDSHPDLMMPKQLDVSKIHDKEHVINSLSIENWIMPAIYAGHFSSIAWIKPPWATQLSNGVHNFKIGHDKVEKDIRVTCPESYFVSECVWSPGEEEMDNVSEVNLEVCTLGNPLPPDAVDLYIPVQTGSIEKTNNSLSETFTDRLTNCPYILDIDLDFYSTTNPFLSMYTKEQFAMLSKLYHYEHPTEVNAETLKAVMANRKEQLNEFQSILQKVQEGVNLKELPQTPRLLALEPLLATFPDGKPPDPVILNDAGCTCDNCELPHHISTRDQVHHLVLCTKDFLSQLPKPAVVTVARSSDDDYCPSWDVDFIQDVVLEMLVQVYGPIEITKDY